MSADEQAADASVAAGDEATGSRATAGPSADPLRTIRLMWEPPPAQTRGRKAKLSLQQIVDAAITIADRDGVESLSMRNVAAALQAGTMSLYTYVSSKADLLEVMVDRVHLEIEPADPQAGWRAQLIGLYSQFWRLYHRHPWMLQINLQRQSLGPNVIDAAEALFVILRRIGLSASAMAHSATLLTSYVHGAARGSILEAQTVAATGIDIEQYYAARWQFWDTYFDRQRFPAHTDIWEAGGFDDTTDPFLFGLERILDGLEALASRTSSADA